MIDSPKVSVCHLSGAIDYAAHDGNGHTGQMPSALPYLVCHLLQVKERAPTARARHIVGFGVAHP